MKRNIIESVLRLPLALRSAGLAIAFASALHFQDAAAESTAGKPLSKTKMNLPRTEHSPRPDTEEIPNFAREALVGWALRDVTAGDTLLESHLGDQNFTPGSTQKLFTTWIALELLGGDRTYVTELFRSGSVEGGTLKGDLIIKGGGDPSFGGAQFGPEHGANAIFTQWAKALKEAGIKRVEGCVIGDGSFLTEDGPHPASLWEDAGNYYAGTVSGLAFNDNLFHARFSGASSPGKAVSFQGAFPPHTGIVRFDNRLVTGPADSQDSAYIIGGFPSPVRDLRGTYPAGRMPFTIKGSLPNPAWTCAREFRDVLTAKGITVTGPPDADCGDSLSLPNHAGLATVVGATAVPGARHVSPPLKELIRIVNQKSDNNYAAQMLALLGKGSGRRGDWRGGLEAAYAWLDAHGFDRRRVHLKDGNGLSRYNWIAPSQTSLLLSYAYRQKAFPEYRASLIGSPGATGKLDRYGDGWEGRLYAKTGTLEGVSALAGYLKCASGRWIAFSIAANNFEAPNGDAQRFFGPMLRKWAGKY
ncbi:MAG: D-alanyl-D-alanine carboxypeptidase/D-alanyl-D-alanine-endopeptidase [Fibrobacteria bacterium]